jgi:hypothetical protein
MAQAQCTPDPSLTVEGIYPDTLRHGCKDAYYTDTIDFVFPSDTTIVTPFGTITVPFDSFTVVSVNLIPAGLTYQCNVPSCTYIPPGGGSPAKGCVSISGTPTVTTTSSDSVEITGRAFVTIFGSAQSFDEIIRMNLLVQDPTSPGCATYRDDAFNNALKMTVAPNPMDASSILSYNLKNGANVEVSLIDITGRTIANLLNERQSVGLHTVDLWQGNMAPGVYFVRLSLDGGAHIRTQKVVVQ